MSDDVSRRNFMKTASAATAGITIMAGQAPFSYAANEKIKCAMIGTGGQGGFHLRFGIPNTPEIEMAAVCDVFEPHQEGGWKFAAGVTDDSPDPKRDVKRYYDYKQMLDEIPDLDAVMIVTPLYTHHDIAIDCLDAGKHIFLQKTMCFDVEQCRNLVKKVHETGKVCQIGHQRRYNPEYNKAVWLARGSDERRSVTGRINHVEAWWHRNNDWRRPVDLSYKLNDIEKKYITEGLEKHINWRLYKERSRGGLITELATHQLDVTNWFLGTPPARVSAYGGIDYWKDGREVNDNIVMIYEYDISRDDAGFAVIPKRNDKQKMSQINRDYTVRLTYSSICANTQRSYGEQFFGDRGGIKTTEQHGCTFYPEPAAESFNVVQNTAGNAKANAKAVTSGGTRDYKGAYDSGVPILCYDDKGNPYAEAVQVDAIQFRSFAKDVINGTTPKANEIVGLQTAVAGFAAAEAMAKGGGTVEIDPAQYTFDFETPDPYRYDYFEEWKKEEEDPCAEEKA